jgi:hypothetical protein
MLQPNLSLVSQVLDIFHILFMKAVIEKSFMMPIAS